MVPIIVGAGIGLVALGKWIHKSINDAQQADQQRQLTRQVHERSVRLKQETKLARKRSQALAYLDQNLIQITGSLESSLQKLPFSRSRSYLSQLDARTTEAKARIMWSSDPMDTAYESVSVLLNISSEASAEAARVISR